MKTPEKHPRSRFQKRTPPHQTGVSHNSASASSADATTATAMAGEPRDTCWCPRASVFFNFLLSARVTSSFFSNISDCDETFNYWEPLHFLLYGTGFQTWEYSPVYAVRSYAYLNLHSFAATVMKDVFAANKVTVFYYVRFFLAILCAACETYFYKGIMMQFDAHVARLYMAFAAVSTAMFISSSALLPSSFTMYMCLLAYGGWFQGNYVVAIFAIAFGTLLGWPFFAVLGLPIAYDIVVRRRLVSSFVMWSACIGVAILIPLVAVDSHYYGKQVLAPLNIVLYNVFGGGGPDLYGVEPWTFYFINGLLNFNIIFLMALVSLPLCLLLVWTTGRGRRHSLQIPMWLVLSGLYIWVAIFFTRPHKEERFLFPVYPLFLLNGCLMLSRLQHAYDYFFPPSSSSTEEEEGTRSVMRHYSDSSNWIAGVLVLLFALLSVSRSAALFTGYHAPLDIYQHLHNSVHPVDPDTNPPAYELNERVNVCVGREWYRYTSSFFLPHEWKLLFIKSEFAGQLPQPYQGRGSDATKRIPENMNDMNREEMSVYSSLDQCDLLVDVDVKSESQHEPNYSTDTKNWKVVYSVPFLDSLRSHRLWRAFYVPFVSPKYCSYINYNVLKSTNKRTKVVRNRGGD